MVVLVEAYQLHWFAVGLPVGKRSSYCGLEFLYRILIVVGLDTAVGWSSLASARLSGNLAIVKFFLFFLEIFVKAVCPLAHSANV